jgi:DNA-binding Lrp family transcriptional regulator
LIFDELDRALLRELQDYARQSNTELASAVGVAPAVVADRVQALFDRGVILGYRTEIDLSIVGRGVQALIAVRIRASASQAIDNFRSWASNTPEMVDTFVTSGNSDFVLHVAVPTTHDLYSFIADQLVTRPAVFEVRTSLVFEHFRTHTIEPIDHATASRHRTGSSIPTPYPTAWPIPDPVPRQTEPAIPLPVDAPQFD